MALTKNLKSAARSVKTAAKKTAQKATAAGKQIAKKVNKTVVKPVADWVGSDSKQGKKPKSRKSAAKSGRK